MSPGQKCADVMRVLCKSITSVDRKDDDDDDDGDDDEIEGIPEVGVLVELVLVETAADVVMDDKDKE